MPSIHILDLPEEIVNNIIQKAILARVWRVETPGKLDTLGGISRVLRLRLVCKAFDALFRSALFATRILDIYLPLDSKQATQTLRYWPTRRNHGAQKLWHSYLIYRVQNEVDPSTHRYVEVRQTAETLFKSKPLGLSLQSIIESLCWLALGNVAGRVAPKAHPERFVIPNGPRVNLLSAAAYLNQIDLAERLLQEGTDPTHHDDLFPAAIEAAALAGHANMLLMFQERLPDAIPPLQSSEWVYQEFIGHSTLPTVLCKGKADPQAVVGAALNGDMDILNMALYPPSRSNLESRDYFDQPHGSVAERSRPGITLRAAMLHSKSVDVYRTLSRFFPDGPNVVNHLERFCEFGNFEIVKHLLDNGQRIDGWLSARQASPIHEAARHGHEDIVDLLIDRGADINKRRGEYKTPLFAAVSGGFIRIAQKLIDKGARCDMHVLKQSLSTEYPAMTRLLLPHFSAQEVHLNLAFLTDLSTPLDLIPLLELIGEHPGLGFRNGKVRPPVPLKPEKLLDYDLRRERQHKSATQVGR